MKAKINRLCSMLMALSLMLLSFIGVILFIVIMYKMVFKFIDAITEINTMYWWVILSIISTFVIALLGSIFTQKK